MFQSNDCPFTRAAFVELDTMIAQAALQLGIDQGRLR